MRYIKRIQLTAIVDGKMEMEDPDTIRNAIKTGYSIIDVIATKTNDEYDGGILITKEGTEDFGFIIRPTKFTQQNPLKEYLSIEVHLYSNNSESGKFSTVSKTIVLDRNASSYCYLTYCNANNSFAFGISDELKYCLDFCIGMGKSYSLDRNIHSYLFYMNTGAIECTLPITPTEIDEFFSIHSSINDNIVNMCGITFNKQDYITTSVYTSTVFRENINAIEFNLNDVTYVALSRPVSVAPPIILKVG